MYDVPVTLELPNRAPTSAVALVIERSMATRVARAALIWVALWGAMVVCVFIPVLHFVLVPTLLVLGPVMAFLRLRERVSIRSVRGECPGCQAPRELPGSGPLKDGRWLHCEGCGSQVVLRLP